MRACSLWCLIGLPCGCVMRWSVYGGCVWCVSVYLAPRRRQRRRSTTARCSRQPLLKCIPSSNSALQVAGSMAGGWYMKGNSVWSRNSGSWLAISAGDASGVPIVERMFGTIRSANSAACDAAACLDACVWHGPSSPARRHRGRRGSTSPGAHRLVIGVASIKRRAGGPGRG